MADYQLNGKTVIHTAYISEIGARENQEDATGTSRISGGVLAVVSDGMGGLNNGEKISQITVMSMLRDGRNIDAAAGNKALIGMLVNACSCIQYYQEQNQDYNSGATVVAVLAEPNCLHWLSVGDSHIYLFRSGILMQINREHTYEYDLHLQLVNREISFTDLEQSAKRGSLTSYMGLRKLTAIDESVVPLQMQPGDRVLLATDGVFKTLSDHEISEILDQYPQADAALGIIKEEIGNKNLSRQDNYSAVLIDYL